MSYFVYENSCLSVLEIAQILTAALIKCRLCKGRDSILVGGNGSILEECVTKVHRLLFVAHVSQIPPGTEVRRVVACNNELVLAVYTAKH